MKHPVALATAALTLTACVTVTEVPPAIPSLKLQPENGVPGDYCQVRNSGAVRVLDVTFLNDGTADYEGGDALAITFQTGNRHRPRAGPSRPSPKAVPASSRCPSPRPASTPTANSPSPGPTSLTSKVSAGARTRLTAVSQKPMSPNFAYATIMFAAGVGVPTLAALNASLGTRIGSPSAAALVLFVVALIVAAIATLVTGPQALKAIPAQPKHLYLAGALIAFYVLTITYIAPHFGVGNAVFFVLLGQLVAAAAIDHFGLFGARVTPLSFTRASGIALMAAGLALTQRG